MVRLVALYPKRRAGARFHARKQRVGVGKAFQAAFHIRNGIFQRFADKGRQHRVEVGKAGAGIGGLHFPEAVAYSPP